MQTVGTGTNSAAQRRIVQQTAQKPAAPVAAPAAPKSAAPTNAPRPQVPKPPPVVPTNTGQYAVPAPMPQSTAPGPVTPVKSLEEWLGTDTGYLNALAQQQQDMTNFTANQAVQQNNHLQQYQQGITDLEQQRKMSGDNLFEDYATRGMANSGAYADALSQFNTEFDNRRGAAEQDNSSFAAQLASALASQQNSQSQSRTQAYNDAVARRAAALLGAG